MPEVNDSVSTNIRGVDKELWRWAKAQAMLEGKTLGEKINELLAEAKRRSETS